MGNLINKKNKSNCVRCLEKPYGVNEPQNLEREREEDAVFFDQVFHTDVVPIYPKLMQMVKKDVNGFGATNCH